MLCACVGCVVYVYVCMCVCMCERVGGHVWSVKPCEVEVVLWDVLWGVLWCVSCGMFAYLHVHEVGLCVHAKCMRVRFCVPT